MKRVREIEGRLTDAQAVQRALEIIATIKKYQPRKAEVTVYRRAVRYQALDLREVL